MNRYTHVLKLALRNLMAQRLRSLLTVLGIVLGVASVIIMLAVGEAARFEAIEQIRQLGATNIIIRSAKPTGEEKKERQQQFILDYGLKMADLDRIQFTIPTITEVTATREFVKEARYLDRKMDARIVAASPEQAEQANLKIALGRFLDEIDEAGKANVCVIGYDVAEKLFPYEDPMNKAIRLDGSQYYRIIGVTDMRGSSKPGAGELRDFDKEIYVPFGTDKVRTGSILMTMKAGNFQAEKLELSQITVSVDTLENVKSTAEIIACLLEQYHPQKDYAITVPLDLLEKAERTQRIFSLVLGAIASISLVVGGIGIMNIMLATVTERTREIGVRRALGAKRGDITSQFLAESVVLTSLGGVLGVSLGVGGSLMVTRFFELPTIITPWSGIVAFSVSVLVGLLFGIYPARRAAFMDPIEALRHE